MHLALYHPVIPQNTGNIGRLCVGMGAELHIVGPCGFDFSDAALKRAGLDYWPHLTWQLHEGEQAFLRWLGDRSPWIVTKFGALRYDQAIYESNAVLILGNENTGVPTVWRERWADRCIAIPIMGQIRSYNQANAAAIVLAQARSSTNSYPR